MFYVQVTKDNINWDVSKRYSECRFFYDAVSEVSGKLKSEFPAKNVGKMNIEATEKRKLGLNLWFNEFLESVPLSPSLTNQVYAFFNVHENCGAGRYTLSCITKPFLT